MNQIFIGDNRDVMRQLIARGVKVQACVTSPPYWGLRDYGIEPTVWGGDRTARTNGAKGSACTRAGLTGMVCCLKAVGR